MTRALISIALLILVSACDFFRVIPISPLDTVALADREAALVSPTRRCLVVADSQAVVGGRELLDEARHAPRVTLDLVAAQPGMGLRDLPGLLEALAQPEVALFPYSCVLVVLGVNDAFAERDRFGPFFEGTETTASYAQRIDALLGALPPGVPVFWLGIPAQTAHVQPWAVAAINISIIQAQARHPGLHYVDPEVALGGLSPRFQDGVHYSASAARLVFRAMLERARGL